VIFDYETLKLIWWVLIGVLLIGFAVADGFDLGVGALLPFVGRNDEERRLVINCIGPIWEGNQVWLITAGGAIFAAWPAVYAAAFSGMYIALLLVLFALFFRPVGFEYRSKLANLRWRSAWDWGLFAAGLVPALVFGVAFGNLFQGLPFHFDASMRSYYQGSFFALLNPFALLTGAVSLAMLVMHGAVFLCLRTEDVIRQRAARAARSAAVVFIVVFATAGVWVSTMEGFRLAALPGADTASAILAKTVAFAPGGWLDNYRRYPWMVAAPLTAFTGAASVVYWAGTRPVAAFLCSAAVLAGVILTAGFSLFPFLMPSSVDPVSSLTLWDATSSRLTLSWMFWAAMVLLPVVLSYTVWVYRKLWGRVTVEAVRREGDSLY
jgi:cytochrome d ubiquinol oxidase subunit II